MSHLIPARLPQLLMNGTTGIAVGMATNIPPHNVGELCDALIDLSKHKDLTVEMMANSPARRLLERLAFKAVPGTGRLVTMRY